jgi:hypothetical protein
VILSSKDEAEKNSYFNPFRYFFLQSRKADWATMDDSVSFAGMAILEEFSFLTFLFSIIG